MLREGNHKKTRKKPDMMGSMQYVRICLMILREISSRSVKADGRSKHASGSWRQISQQDPFIFIGMRESMPTFSFVSYRCWSTGCWRRNWTRSIPAQIFWIPFKTLSLQMFKDRDLSPFMSLRNWPMTYIELVGLKRTMNSSQKERWKRFKNAANKDKLKNFLTLLYQNQKRLYIKTKRHRWKPLVEWAFQRCFVLFNCQRRDFSRNRQACQLRDS